jgi:ERCC4-type nuclease
MLRVKKKAVMDSPKTLSLKILVDDRERSGGLVEALRRITAFPIEVCRLAVGDVWIGERLVVERKEAADFVASLADGRLERQLSELTGVQGQGLLLIEGEFNPRALAGMAARGIRQAILAVTLDRRIPVIRSRNLEDTARWLVALAERAAFRLTPLASMLEPGMQPVMPHPAGHRSPRPAAQPDPQAVQRSALERIPGIGAVKAQALLTRFGSLQSLISANVEDLAAVQGIGFALARMIQKAFARRG